MGLERGELGATGLGMSLTCSLFCLLRDKSDHVSCPWEQNQTEAHPPSQPAFAAGDLGWRVPRRGRNLCREQMQGRRGNPSSPRLQTPSRCCCEKSGIQSDFVPIKRRSVHTSTFHAAPPCDPLTELPGEDTLTEEHTVRWAASLPGVRRRGQVIGGPPG